MAKALGAGHVVGVCSAKNADFVLAQGADAVLDYHSHRIGDKDAKTMDGKSLPAAGFDVVYDTATNSGGQEDYLAAGTSLLRADTEVGGQYVALNGGLSMWLRYATGTQQKNRHLFLTNMNTADLELVASLATPTSDTTSAKIAPRVCSVFPFTPKGLSEGFSLLQSRRTVGKICFDMRASSE
jgi:NADPH:quinone reductase-like Zn-dependent oxidoreductase